MNLSKAVKTVRLKADGTNYTATAGTSNINSEEIDTTGFDAVRFLIGFGVIVSGGVTSIKVQQDVVTGMAGAADLAGSAITVADTDDNKITSTDIIKPLKKFLRVSILRATQNATVDFVIAELYQAKVVPISDHATVISSKLHISPAEGTA